MRKLELASTNTTRFDVRNRLQRLALVRDCKDLDVVLLAGLGVNFFSEITIRSVEEATILRYEDGCGSPGGGRGGAARRQDGVRRKLDEGASGGVDGEDVNSRRNLSDEVGDPVCRAEEKSSARVLSECEDKEKRLTVGVELKMPRTRSRRKLYLLLQVERSVVLAGVDVDLVRSKIGNVGDGERRVELELMRMRSELSLGVHAGSGVRGDLDLGAQLAGGRVERARRDAGASVLKERWVSSRAQPSRLKHKQHSR